MKHAKFVSFTLCGAQTVQKAVKLLPDFRCERYTRTVDASLSGTSLKRFAQQAMVDCDLIVFVGATGIAVRAVAPYLMGKAYDPAVIVIDEQGKFVIPLLSGHLGGANMIAEILAQGLQAVPVLTTATDGRQVFAVDTWAKAHSCAVLEPHYIKYVSGALLRGETVGVRSDFPIEGLLPARIDLKKDAESGFTIGFRTDAQPFTHTLHLVPRIAYLGIGCRKGTSADAIEQTVQAALASAKLPWQAICGAASIDIKQVCCCFAKNTDCRSVPLRPSSCRTHKANSAGRRSCSRPSASIMCANARLCAQHRTAHLSCINSRRTA